MHYQYRYLKFKLVVIEYNLQKDIKELWFRKIDFCFIRIYLYSMSVVSQQFLIRLEQLENKNIFWGILEHDKLYSII